MTLATPFMGSLHAATISDPNIFNNGTTQATVATDSTYPSSSFAPGNVDDLGENQFYFSDDQAPADLMSISNFNAASGIGTLRFYDAEEFGGRTAQSVTIYTSTTNQSVLTPASYTLLGTFALTTSDGTTSGHYTTGSDSSGGDGNFKYYDDVSGLSISDTTQSLLFDFGVNNGIGYGFTEIQAFAPVPEPSTYAMILSGAAFLGFFLHRRKNAIL